MKTQSLKASVRSGALLSNELTALIGNRLYTGLAPANSATPYIVMSIVGNREVYGQEGSSGVETTRFQFDIHGATIDSVGETRDALVESLNTHCVKSTIGEVDFSNARLLSDVELFDKNVRTFRRAVDFTFSYISNT